MPATRIEPIETREDWRAAIPVVRQLWSHVDREFVDGWFEEEAYTPFGLYREGEDVPVAVVGVSVQRVLHHVRHAWIHDLVVDEAHRGEGYGSELIEFVERWARERDCEYVALALVEGNDDAERFYEDCDMERWGHVVEKEL